jgi:hypothetical protein
MSPNIASLTANLRLASGVFKAEIVVHLVIPCDGSGTTRLVAAWGHKCYLYIVLGLGTSQP